MASLADIRARLAAQDNKKNKSFTDGEGPVYPHWNIAEGDTAILRFLPDANTNNPYFWLERAMFKFPFNGIKGDPTASSNIIVQVPCMEMYGEKDAVLDEVRTWFKDTALEEMGRKYWKKRTFFYQGFVRQDPMNSPTPENPIRRFMISPQIHNIIKNSLMDPEIKNLPTDTNEGLDFRINKQAKGGYADYTNSSWSRNYTALTEDEITAMTDPEHGIQDLTSFLPVKPTEEVQKVIREMFEASVEGEPYDPERWGAYYTPPGMAKTDKALPGSTGGPAATAVTPAVVEAATATAAAPVVETPVVEAVIEEAPFVPDTPVVEAVVETVAAEAVVETVADDVPKANTEKAQDILAMIRSRQQ